MNRSYKVSSISEQKSEFSDTFAPTVWPEEIDSKRTSEAVIEVSVSISAEFRDRVSIIKYHIELGTLHRTMNPTDMVLH